MQTPPPDLPQLLDELADLSRECRADELARISTFRSRLGDLRGTVDADRPGGWVPLCEAAERIVEQVERRGILDAESAFAIVGEMVRKVREELVAPLPAERPAQRRMLVLGGSGSSGSSLRMMDSENLGELLVRLQMVRPEDLQRALAMQQQPEHRQRKIGEILIELELLTPQALETALQMQAGSRRGPVERPADADPWGDRPL
jgi:hypothetical protein